LFNCVITYKCYVTFYAITANNSDFLFDNVPLNEKCCQAVGFSQSYEFLAKKIAFKKKHSRNAILAQNNFCRNIIFGDKYFDLKEFCRNKNCRKKCRTVETYKSLR